MEQHSGCSALPGMHIRPLSHFSFPQHNDLFQARHNILRMLVSPDGCLSQQSCSMVPASFSVFLPRHSTHMIMHAAALVGRHSAADNSGAIHQLWIAADNRGAICQL